ncbi:OB-fold domain-containing protein [Amycolatopsis jejuensis]|uniref:OB-fold domain-containing protein n=1 Tax=Amycolatopsis jejuensis TaxID=330084 RepID=UPI00068FF6AB|nr:OB-fold domain-containing protein [Amycolatopsis jejuensis]
MPLLPITSTPETADYLAGAARGELRITRDLRTGACCEPSVDPRQDPARYLPGPAGGEATIVSWSVAHRRAADGVERTLFGIVELDEGPWLWVELRGPEPWTGLSGRRVRAAFVKSGPRPEHATLPVFVLPQP